MLAGGCFVTSHVSWRLFCHVDRCHALCRSARRRESPRGHKPAQAWHGAGWILIGLSPADQLEPGGRGCAGLVVLCKATCDHETTEGVGFRVAPVGSTAACLPINSSWRVHCATQQVPSSVGQAQLAAGGAKASGHSRCERDLLPDWQDLSSPAIFLSKTPPKAAEHATQRPPAAPIRG